MWVSVALRFLLALVVCVLEWTIYGVLSASSVGSVLVQVRRLSLEKNVTFAATHAINVFWFRLQSTLGACTLERPSDKTKPERSSSPASKVPCSLRGSQSAGPAWSWLAVTTPCKHMYSLCAGSISATAVSCSCCTALFANVNTA